MSQRVRKLLFSFRRPGHVARFHSKFCMQSGKVVQDLFKSVYTRINVLAKIMWMPPKVIASALFRRLRHVPLDHLEMQRVGLPKLAAARAQKMTCWYIRTVLYIQ